MAPEAPAERTDPAVEQPAEQPSTTDTDDDSDLGRDWTRAKRVVGAMFVIGAMGNILPVATAGQRSPAVLAGLVGVGVCAYAVQRWTRADATRLKFRLAILAFVLASVVAIPVRSVLGDVTFLVTLPFAVVLYVAFSRRSSGSVRGLLASATD